MQPYFAPYLGYFDLIHQCDCWVVFDSAQYIRRGWVNRNRLLKPGGGWTYATVPVQYAPLDTPIYDIRVQGEEWKSKIMGQLDVIKKQAPYFRPIREMLEEAFSTASTSLCELNVSLLARCCKYIGIDFSPTLISKLEIDAGQIGEPGDWALEVCAKMSADEYLNPPGGQALYKEERFAARGVRLRIQSYEPLRYETPGFTPEENLSIFDVLAWNSPETVLAHLQSQAWRSLKR